jgi:hypothetical protein
MRGRKTDAGARTVITRHGFLQNTAAANMDSAPTLRRSYVLRLPSMNSLKQFSKGLTTTAIKQRDKVHRAGERGLADADDRAR